MERNAEKLIQEKIRMSEQEPVAWKNEWVWSRVELPKKRKNKVFWYAAAAVIIGFTSIGFYWTSVKYNSDLMVQIELLESQLADIQLSAAPTEEIIANCVEEEPDKSAFVKPERQVQKSSISVAAIAIPVIEVQVNNIADQIEVSQAVAVAIIPDEEPEVNIVEKQPEIKPVIGRIPATSHYASQTNKKELKLLIFKPESQEARSDNNPKEYKILSARIN